nr:MAG TPA: hypothetical protein [Caudoviricetes sp.]
MLYNMLYINLLCLQICLLLCNSDSENRKYIKAINCTHATYNKKPL